MNDVTKLLDKIEDGEPTAAEQLLPLVYQELRRLAALKLANEKPGQTLQPTALVHEAYLKLVGADNDIRWSSRGHFFAAAAEAMRRILIDNARRKKSARHGGGLERRPLLEDDAFGSEPDQKLLALDAVLERLLAENPLIGELVKLRYFGGLTTEEAARALNISARTAKRYWVYAKAWLRRGLDRELA